MPPAAQYLLGWVGLDGLRGRFGDCDARVEVAGQTAAVFKGLTARQIARRIAVPVQAGRPISLITDFGPNGEIGNDVNWCDLMVIARPANR